MTVEALYAVRFGHAGSPHLGLNGGVVVLETERLFGGDSWFAYTGNYVVAGNTVTGQLHAVRHFNEPGTESAWGTQENEFDVEFTATLNEAKTEALGSLTRGGIQLGMKLVRVAELPG